MKIWLSLALVFSGFSIGCRDDLKDNRWMPAPVTDPPPYEIAGQGIYCYGDSFKMSRITEENRELHQCILIGIDTPKPGQNFYTQAALAGNKLVRRKKVVLRVKHRDRWSHECGFLYNEANLDVGLELIRRGLGWYSGEEFPGSDAYQKAEAEAREKQIGLWSDTDPVPPWEFQEQQDDQFQKRLKR